MSDIIDITRQASRILAIHLKAHGLSSSSSPSFFFFMARIRLATVATGIAFW